MKTAANIIMLKKKNGFFSFVLVQMWKVAVLLLWCVVFGLDVTQQESSENSSKYNYVEEEKRLFFLCASSDVEGGCVVAMVRCIRPGCDSARMTLEALSEVELWALWLNTST